MNYENALEYIYSRRKFAKSSSFERILALLENFGNPQNKLKFIHVVGTNGKGSVSTELSFIIQQAGYKAGLFTSPFVTEFCERIQINQSYIPKDTFASIVEQIKNVNDELEKQNLTPTFFEVVFAAALIYFEREGCSLVVLEAGLGGRTDSTNIIPAPLVTVITSISPDHTQVLGNTITQIAKEKCAVIKNRSTVISFPCDNAGFDFIAQPKDAVTVMKSRCQEKDCTLIFPNMNTICSVQESIDGTAFEFDSLPLFVKFTGDHQIANAAVAVCAAKALDKHGFTVTNNDIQKGLSAAFLPARMEVISRSPLVIIDGGHNIGCMTALAKMIKKNLNTRKITALIGFMKDKDYSKAIGIIAPLCETIVCTNAESERGEDAWILAEIAKKYCKNVYCLPDISEAFKCAVNKTDTDGALICAGSFYLVSDIRKIFCT